MSIHSLVCTERHLLRVQDYVHDKESHLLRIIHVLWDDLYDRYIVLVDCDPATHTLLELLC